jgi:hypothetical protein
VDEFDEILLTTIDQTLSYILGSSNATIIFDYLERNGCPKQQIPRRLDLFCTVLEKVVGGGRSQILGVAAILEFAIAEQLAKNLGIPFHEAKPIDFCAYVKRLRRECILERTENEN